MHVGLVGYGYWGQKVARAFKEACVSSKILAVADCNEDALKAAKTLYPDIHTYRSMLPMILDERLQGVIIATPPKTHYELAKAALSFKNHLLIEKPFTFSASEALELIELAKAQNVQVIVDHTLCYAPLVHYLKHHLKTLPWPQHIVSTRRNVAPEQLKSNYNCSVLWDLAPHDLAVIDFLMDLVPLKVTAWGNTAAVLLKVKYSHNVTAEISVSWDGPCRNRDLIIAGNGYCLGYDGLANKLNIHVPDNVHVELGMYEEPLKNLARDFLRCHVDNRPSEISGHVRAMRVVKILEAAQKSLNTEGRTITI